MQYGVLLGIRRLTVPRPFPPRSSRRARLWKSLLLRKPALEAGAFWGIVPAMMLAHRFEANQGV
jgi:hypothetical protein